MQTKGHDISRRSFLRGGAIVGAAAAATVALPGCTATVKETDAEAKLTKSGGTVPERVTTELPIPEMDPPAKTTHDSDVLVIGGGFAGVNAAIAAAEAGCSVILVDKGTPGYAGLSAWPGTHAWFDPDFDDYDACYESIFRSGEYLANVNWLKMWLDESKETKERLEEWGLLDQYDRASDVDMSYWTNGNFVGYQNDVVAPHDRHARFMSLLEEKGVTVVTHTMITKVVVDDNAARGAIGFYVPSATPMSFNAKTVIMCMGQGAYKVQGWPTGCDTFDGECIAYNLGLPICNKETEDYHSTNSTAPGQTFMSLCWTYLENFFFCPIPSVDPADPNAYGRNQCRFILYAPSYREGATVITKYEHAEPSARKTAEENGGDVRCGKQPDAMWSDGNRLKKVGGASPGFCGHLMPGVHCGWDDTCGFTGIDGLYVAGDGMNAAPPNGFGYGTIHGLTSSYVSLQGHHAGLAAADYAKGATLAAISDDVFAEESERILNPLARGEEADDCIDATWCYTTLANIMTPYFTAWDKTDECLSAALSFVERLRDDEIPRLTAANAHDLRLCHEAMHKILSAEMKLRASLARKESRGFCFHRDYQYRKDDEYLCHIGCVKQADGTMGIEKFPMPEEWTGDLAEDYNTRYPNPFPNEEEDLKKLGISVTRPEPTLKI